MSTKSFEIEQVQKISEKTLVPLSVVLVLSSMVFSFSHIYSRVEENRFLIDKAVSKRFEVDKRIFDQINSLRSKVTQVSEKANRAEGKLDIIIMHVQKK